MHWNNRLHKPYNYLFYLVFTCKYWAALHGNPHELFPKKNKTSWGDLFVTGEPLGTTSLSDNRFPHREITSGFAGNQYWEFIREVWHCNNLQMTRRRNLNTSFAGLYTEFEREILQVSSLRELRHPKKRKVLNLASWVLERKRRLPKKNTFIGGFQPLSCSEEKMHRDTQAGLLLLLSTIGRCPEISLHMFVKFSPMLPLSVSNWVFWFIKTAKAHANAYHFARQVPCPNLLI